MAEAWVTEADPERARIRFTAGIPGFVPHVARLDNDRLTFGPINAPGAVRPLPAVVPAAVCGQISGTATYPVDREQRLQAVALLGPAEAATHMRHPSLVSWRELLAGGTPGELVPCNLRRAP